MLSVAFGPSRIQRVGAVNAMSPCDPWHRALRHACRRLHHGPGLLTILRRPGRKAVVTPVREGVEPAATTIADPALLKAPARAFRRKRKLENGRDASITELAAAEKIERGYLGRALQPTLLAPEMPSACNLQRTMAWSWLRGGSRRRSTRAVGVDSHLAFDTSLMPSTALTSRLGAVVNSAQAWTGCGDVRCELCPWTPPRRSLDAAVRARRQIDAGYLGHKLDWLGSFLPIQRFSSV